MNCNKRIVFMFATVVVWWLSPQAGAQTPLGSEFTYQGDLKLAGVPFDGMADFDFSLWDAEVLGSQIGSTVSLLGETVTEGLFTVELDFGTDALNGDQRWLEIMVDGILLSPRQKVTGAPYAIQTRGLFVDDAGNVGIGTDAPVTELDVNGRIKATNPGGTPDGSSVQLGSPANQPGVIFRLGDGFGNEISRWDLRYTGDGSLLLQHDTSMTNVWLAQDNGNLGIGTSTPSNKLTVGGDADFTGNVGIGTTSPATELDVVGTVTATSFVGDGSGLTEIDVDDADADPGNELQTLAGVLGQGNDAGGADMLNLGEIRTNDNDLRLRGGSDNDHGLGWYGLDKLFAGTHVFGPVLYGRVGGALATTEGGEKIVLRWDSAGNVGIGTTTPEGPLQVKGGNASESDCCVYHEAPGCDDPECEAIVCDLDPFCCSSFWDDLCVTGAQDNCEICGSTLLLITESGNVGIGTTTPSAKLQIAGTPGVDGIMLPDGSLLTTAAGLIPEMYQTQLDQEYFDFCCTERRTHSWQNFTAMTDDTPGTPGELVGIAVYRDSFATAAVANLFEGEQVKGKPVATTSFPAAATVGWQTASFPNLVSIVAGDMYTIQLVAEGGFTHWWYQEPGMYEFGRAAHPDRDFNFRTYILDPSGSGELEPAVFVEEVTGNVGIGTVTPATKLDVVGTVTATSFVGDGSGLTAISGNPSYGSSAGSPDDAVFVDDDGNVGIGTINPNSTLAVANDAADNAGSPSGGLTFDNSNAGGFGHAAIYSDGSAGFNGDLVFATDGDGTKNYNPTEKMRITHDGEIRFGNNQEFYPAPFDRKTVIVAGRVNGGGGIETSGVTSSNAIAEAVNDNTGDYTITFVTNTFTSAPIVTATAIFAANDDHRWVIVSDLEPTGFHVRIFNTIGDEKNAPFNFIAIGER